ncbi:hypothetical protein CKO28_09235 [Rhodovibrio sodomensis]|uniref:Uncharacterized protein n=1 Tax=Rhodovibrio sodomensis TaxID=1088 RepID=A0ABS1DCT8_9PROT|nr:hypothetical protein [Rhodovibrio sodomensis]MBK1668220.1 hypothetical protein [Rhodovibrio sodomensis]
MAQIISFPETRPTSPAPATPGASSGVAAEVHRLLPVSGTTRPGHGGAMPPLHELVARMRADSEQLTRSLGELQTAVRRLADADLPGQARALVDEAFGHPRAEAAR